MRLILLKITHKDFYKFFVSKQDVITVVKDCLKTVRSLY